MTFDFFFSFLLWVRSSSSFFFFFFFWGSVSLVFIYSFFHWVRWVLGVEGKKKRKVKTAQGTSMGPTNNWKILSDDKWVMVPNGVGWGVLSDEWWVIKTEWWVMGDENWVMSDHFFKTKQGLSSLSSIFITLSSIFRLHHFSLQSSSLRSSLFTIFFIFSLVAYPSSSTHL